MADILILPVVPVERPAELKCNGVGRDAEHDRAVCFYFSRKVTDAEMRFLHDCMARAAIMAPSAPDDDGSAGS